LATDLDEPTVALVNNFSDGWSKWLQDHSDVAGVLGDCRLIATINDIEIRLPSHAAVSRKSYQSKSYQSKSYQRRSRCTLSGSLNRCSVL